MASSAAKTICLLPGDGIGPEVLVPAVEVFVQAAYFAGFEYTLLRGDIGGDALERAGVPLTDETVEMCRASDAVLLGAVGDPRWDSNPPHLRPEMGLLKIRKELGLYANLRPVRPMPCLLDCSPLKPEIVSGIDFVVVRELAGGLYYGEPRGITGEPGEETAFNTMVCCRNEVERIAKTAFQLARRRRKRVTSVDKADYLEVGRLWRRVVEEVAQGYPDVELSHQYVDNCAMQMVLRPAQFDVVLAENTFGGIMGDIGGMLTGSIATLPSASVGDGPCLYAPVHGSAPHLAGKNQANPAGAIGCVAMMFETSFARPDISAAIRRAVEYVLQQGRRTGDLSRVGGEPAHADAFAQLVQERLSTELEAVVP